MKYVKKGCLFFITVSIVLSASCGHVSTKPKQQEYITIGALFPLTGEYCDEGIRALNGLQLARQEINDNGGVLGKKLDIIALDDKGDEEIVVRQYNILKERGVVAVIGSSFSPATLALAKAAEKDGIPVISPTASSPEVTSGRANVFRMIFLDDYQARALASFASVTLRAKTALVIDGDARYSLASKSFEEAFRSRGGRVVAHERYGDPQEFDAILNKYAAKQPDVIFCPSDYIAAAVLAEAAHRVGLDKTSFIGIDAWDGILNFLHETAVMDRVYYAAPFAFDDTTAKVTEFSQKYFDNFSYMPISTSALSYSAVQILVAAIGKAGSAKAEDIIMELKTGVHEAVTGQLRYDAQNNPFNPQTSVYIMRIKDGYYTSLEKIRI